MARSKKISYVYGADMSELERAWKRIDRGMRKTAAQFERAGRAMTKSLTVPIAAIGAVATKSAIDVDKAMQAIARGTGAQGKDLESLQKSWRKLAGSVTQGFDESAKVLADVNTRLNLTGKKAIDISKKMLDAARMTGEGVDTVVSQSAKAMQDWGVEAEYMGNFLDRIFKAAQLTGIQMGTLSTQLYKYGAGLRGMGFDLESSVALLSQFEKQGVNVERIMGSLSMGLGRMAREGITDASEAFSRLIQEIQNAESVTEATRIAIDVFGSRAGPDMALAIREGRFSVEELIDVLREADGVIQQTSDSTDRFGEKWARTKNKVLLAMEPIGREILNIAESAMPRLEAATDRIANSIGEMSDSSKKKILILAGTMAAGGPLLLAVSAVMNSFRNLGGLMLSLFVSPAGPWILAIATVWALIDAYKNLDAIQKKLTGMTPQEAIDRNAYMERAGEIFRERYGKYPATAVDYEKLDAIIDELIAAEQKAKQATEDLGTEAQVNIHQTAIDVAAQVQEAVTPIPEAAQTTVSAVDEVTAAGERAMSVYEKLAHQIDTVLAADEYAWRYEGGPMPTSIHKENEWDRGEMESAARIGQEVAAEMEKAKKATDDVGKSFDDLVTKGDMWTKSLSDGIASAIVQGRGLADILSEIGRQLAQMLISKALSGIFGGFFGLFHEGGVVGAGGMKTFRGFQPKRYHSGGLIGSDEELAILQKGERVIPRDNPGAVVINVLDKEDLEKVTYEAMAKYPGVQIVTNHVMRNVNERGALAAGVK